MLSECIYTANGGGSTVEQGTGTFPSSGSGTFDCGIDDPDLVYVYFYLASNNRIFYVYVKDGDSITAQRDRTYYYCYDKDVAGANYPTCSGSVITLPVITSSQASIDFSWVAIKY